MSKLYFHAQAEKPNGAGPAPDKEDGVREIASARIMRAKAERVAMRPPLLMHSRVHMLPFLAACAGGFARREASSAQERKEGVAG